MLRAQADANTKTDIEYKGIPYIECHIQVSCIMHQASNMVVCYKVIQLNNCIIHLLLHFSRMDSIWLKREHQESQYNVLIGGDKLQELRSSRYCYMSITEWYVTCTRFPTIAQYIKLLPATVQIVESSSGCEHKNRY